MQTEPFRGVPQASSDWFPVGRASSFPDLISQPLLCKGDATPGCKVFHIPQQDASQGAQVPIADIGWDLKDQVLVFRFRGQFHAIDHVCIILFKVIRVYKLIIFPRAVRIRPTRSPKAFSLILRILELLLALG